MSQPLIALSWEPEVELRSYDELAESTTTAALVASRRYGSKAANLGFLAHRLVLGRVANAGSPSAIKGYDLVPLGFAVPLQYYADFVGHPPNTDLRATLADLIEAEPWRGDLSERKGREGRPGADRILGCGVSRACVAATARQVRRSAARRGKDQD
jgi:hypothetical protein